MSVLFVRHILESIKRARDRRIGKTDDVVIPKRWKNNYRGPLALEEIKENKEPKHDL